MKSRWIHAGLILTVCLAGAAQQAVRAGQPLELTAEFAAVREKIRPRPEEELWKKIPWETSLLEARRIAAGAGKPLFVWSMDGHPLCLG